MLPMEPVKLPSHIDDPHQFLLWQADEIIPVLICGVIGFLIGRSVLCIAVGLVGMHFFKKYKAGKPDGYIIHCLYWIGLWPQKGRVLPNPFEREYLP